MRIAVIGSGNVGAALGLGWARVGHTVTFGLRRPAEDPIRERAGAAQADIQLATVAEALRNDLIVLAVPYTALAGIIEQGPSLQGKILVDCTNPIGPGLTLSVGHTSSGAEQLAALAPGAKVVKAFNTTGYENMERPDYKEQKLAMFLCGDDADANATVATLAYDLGFDPVDAGPLSIARYLEPLAMLWIDMAIKQDKGRDFGFAFLRRS